MQRLVYLLFFASLYINAQELSYVEIDKRSFDLYQNSDWNNLTLLAEHYSKSADYYYFNVRVGVAYYNLKDYYNAEKYFSKAVNNNSTDFALLYLYWSYLNLGQIDQAEETYKMLSKEEQTKIHKEKKWIESVYLEGGEKFSNRSSKGNLGYFSINTFHRLSDKISLYDGISTIDQVNEKGEISQFQLNIFPSFYLNKGFTLNTGLLYAKNKGVLEYTYNTNALTENLDINNFAFYAGISKQSRRFFAELYGYYISQNINASGYYQNQAYSIITNSNTKIVGINLAYVLPLFKNKITIGSMLFSASDLDTNNLLYNPYAILSISSKVWVKASYYPVKETFYVDKSAGIFFTNNDLKMERLAYSFSYNASNHWQFIGTYSKENINEITSQINYNLNSFFLGINYKL